MIYKGLKTLLWVSASYIRRYSLNCERLELFKILEPRFEIDKVLSLTEDIEYDDLKIYKGIYLVSEPFISFTGNKIVTIVCLENTMKGHRMDINSTTYEKGFRCWRIRLVDFEEMKEFKPLIASSNFLWKGRDNED